MKTASILLLIASVFLLGFSVGTLKHDGLVPDQQMMQVGIITADIEQTAAHWAAFFGLEAVPKVQIASGGGPVPTEFRGDPTDATAKLAFIRLENITIELIEPIEKGSTWSEFLQTEGEGVHHIAFDVKGMNERIREFDQHDIPMIQRGSWATGEYAYMDGTGSLGLIIELLEHYNR